VPACIFFTFPLFAGVPFQSSNRGSLIFIFDKTRGFFVLFYFVFLFLNDGQALLHAVDYRKVRTA
jgi:hypothetical protein